MRNCRNYNRNHFFFFFACDLYSLFFIQGVFKSHLKKITPNWKANSHPKSQFDFSYMNVLKNGSAPITHEGWGDCKLCMLYCSWDMACNCFHFGLFFCPFTSLIARKIKIKKKKGIINLLYYCKIIILQ